jgi:hypothetical protein
MEKQSLFKSRLMDVNILDYNEEEKAARLWYLFNQKMLDIFLRDCERLLK